jgi:competence protein ComEC
MVVQYYRYIIQFLVLLAVGVWISVFQLPDNNLHIIACDVGQGDAILITFNNTQILTDGGANNRVLDCLSKHMPFWDREIELVILTHPDRDHSFGLIEVVRRYKIDNLLYNKLPSSSQEYQLLEREVGSRGIPTITPDIGKRIGIGLIYLDILHPSETFTSKKTNDYSIVYKLTYSNFKAIFTGDIEQNVSNSLVNNYLMEDVNYIKIPHHGSRNGATHNLLKASMPEIAVISVGEKNSYGHPHKDILEMLESLKVKVLRTDEVGDVEVITNGEEYWLKD